MNLDHKVSFPETVFSRELDGEMVLLDLTTEQYFGTDEVGTDIWQALRECDCLYDAYESLLETYDVDPEVFKRDFIDFISKLRENRLLDIS